MGLTIVSCGNKSEEKTTVQEPDYANDTVATEVVADAPEADAVSETSKGSEDWDAVLDSYEKYVDQYVKVMKKAQAGDVAAMTEYASMLEKAEDLSNKLEKAGSDLSASQAARYTKISQKLANAAM